MVLYTYDVFISYSRFGLWPRWVHERFRPLLEHWVGEEIGRKVEIFTDERLETGTDWPTELAHRIATSRVLVPLFSRTYFNSRWCWAEFAHMRAREVAVGLRTVTRPDGLIVPAHIHDGDHLPADAQRIQAAKLQDYANVMMHKDSLRYEDLSERIRMWAPDIAAAIERAPTCDPSWSGLAINSFDHLFGTTQPQQTAIPSLG